MATQQQGIDVAWAKPTVAEIKAAGAHFVARYFSPDASKNLTGGEVKAYKAAGLGTVVVWESTAGRATAGHAAGVADAKAAEVERKAVGLPADMVIYFAVDQDTSWASVLAYFDGVISVLGIKRVGAYGGIKIIEGAHGHGIKYLWQTIAWSGGVKSSHATIYQHGGTTLHSQADWDTEYGADYGQYPRPAAPKPKPAPAPAPKPAPKPTPAPSFLEEEVLAYLNIPADTDVNVPVEPAGTAKAPQGGARNAEIWVAFAAQGAATVTVTLHTAKGYGKPTSHKVTADGKVVSKLPTDGSVDAIRVHSAGAPLIAYVVGRQVA